jgi:ATP-dependent helicase/nuclease subunit A
VTDARATDAESRKQIVTDFDHTLFVEAGAGSGKTTAMVSRIMTVLLNGLADIREIAAITFTNEGAASLKSKIQHDLEKAAREGKYATFSGATLTMTAAENERIRKALSYLPLANFSTIHSFCLELLKERPVEAGIDPRFEMNTAGTAEPVFVEAWFRFLIDAARRKHQFLQFAVEEGLDLDGIQKMAEERCENPDLDLYTEKVKPISGKKIEDAFAKAFGLAKEMSDNVGELKRAKPTAVGARRIEFVEEYFKRAESCKSTEEKKRFLLEEEIFHKWVEKGHPGRPEKNEP